MNEAAILYNLLFYYFLLEATVKKNLCIKSDMHLISVKSKWRSYNEKIWAAKFSKVSAIVFYENPYSGQKALNIRLQNRRQDAIVYQKENEVDNPLYNRQFSEFLPFHFRNAFYRVWYMYICVYCHLTTLPKILQQVGSLFWVRVPVQTRVHFHPWDSPLGEPAASLEL